MLRRLRHILAVTIPAVLLGLLAVVLMCFLNRWDEVVVITLIPMWAWASFGVLVSALAWPLQKSPLALISFALWLLVGISLSDETAGLLRTFRAGIAGEAPSPLAIEKEADRLRVVTLHCGDDLTETAEALLRLKPDIVFLQNTSDRAQLIDLTSDLFGPKGSFVRSDSCAILAMGLLTDSFSETDTDSLIVSLERPQGEVLNLANVSLPTAMPRFEIWDPSCWTDLTRRRKDNRRTLRNILSTLSKRDNNKPQLVGGSFGAPPSDDLFRLLRKLAMQDSFRQAGFGWGNTFSGSFPIMRTDQIWATLPYLPERSETFQLDSAQHHGVVSDFRRASPVANLAVNR